MQIRGWDCKTGRPTPKGMPPGPIISKRAATDNNNSSTNDFNFDFALESLTQGA